MTNSEAIKRLKEARSTIQPFRYVDEAIDYAIKTLEELDKTHILIGDSLNGLLTCAYNYGLAKGKRKSPEQEPFINKPCVSEKACEHDKNVVLEKMRAEIEQTAKDYDKFDDYRRVRGLWIALDIIDKYKVDTESEEK